MSFNRMHAIRSVEKTYFEGDRIMNPFQSYRFFYGMSIRHLGLLIRCASEKIYKQGEILFRQGDPVSSFFLIKTGVLALQPEPLAETRVVKTLRSGDVLGWSCLAPGATWDLSGTALDCTTVTILDRGRLLRSVDEYPDFGSDFLKRAAQYEVEILERSGRLLNVQVNPVEGSVIETGETITGNSPFFSNTVDLSPYDAKQLSLHGGQPVRLTDQYGSAIVRVHVKPENSQKCISAN